MNNEWSELNKALQTQLKKESTYKDGLATLFDLRGRLMEVLLSYEKELKREDFDAISFIDAKGYHCKTIAYSIWHVFRIEDIVAHSLICGDVQVFFSGNFKNRIGAPIITTGNELVGQQIADFSKELNITELYSYIAEVKDSTEKILRDLSYQDLKKRISEEQKEYLKSLNVVSTDENAVWLIDYWCKKDVRGLIQMPFSRHWIMHIEASLRIKDRIHP